MNIWKHIEDLAKQAEQQCVWLGLDDDGDAANIVFLGDPFPREVVFVGGTFVPYDETHHARGLRPTTRILINVAVVGTDDVKVLERGVQFFKELAAVRELYPLEHWSFDVQRIGAAGSRKTTYAIERSHELLADERRRYSSLPRFDLARLAEGAIVMRPPVAERPPARAATLAPHDTQAIIGALRALPREATDRFLERFAVQRVRDVAFGQSINAKAFVDGLVREAGVDPFG